METTNPLTPAEKHYLAQQRATARYYQRNKAAVCLRERRRYHLRKHGRLPPGPDETNQQEADAVGAAATA